MGRIGRPPLPAATIALVRDLLWFGSTHAAIAVELKASGVMICERSVRGIAARLGPREAVLAEGETRLERPGRCDHGHLVTILPCRTCRSTPNRLLLDRLAAAEQKAELAGFSLNPPRRPRTKRDYELRSELKPDHQKRLEELQTKRTTDPADCTDS